GKGAAAGAGLAGAGLAVAAAPVAVVVWAAVGIGAWRQYRLPRQTLTFLREKAPTHVRDAQRSHAAPSATRRPRKTLDKPGGGPGMCPGALTSLSSPQGSVGQSPNRAGGHATPPG